MRVALVGPPGSGKGTQGDIVGKRLSIPHISSGELLRQAARSGSELGRDAKEFMDRGQLVPDELVIGLIEVRVAKSDCDSGFLLDGFPRNCEQARKLDGGFDGKALDHVVAIEVPEPVIVARLGGRRVCRGCGRLYHVSWNPPKDEARCDACGAELFTRDDDRENTVRERLAVYRRQTEPLLDFYTEKGLLRRVDGDASPAKVSERILTVLGGCHD